MTRPQAVETNNDAYTANNFTFQFTNVDLASPNFITCEISPVEVQTIEVPEAGTGIVRKYHGGVINYGTMTLTRVRDGGEDDKRMNDLIDAYISTGVKLDGVMVKRHFNKIVRNVHFEGLGATTKALPNYDNATPAPELVTYTFSVDYFEELPV